MVGQTLVGFRKNTHLARGAQNTQRIQRSTLMLDVEKYLHLCSVVAFHPLSAFVACFWSGYRFVCVARCVQDSSGRIRETSRTHPPSLEAKAQGPHVVLMVVETQPQGQG